MTSSNGSIFRVTGPLCGEFTGPGEFPAQRPVTRSFDVFFDLRLNKRLSKQPWGWWFETPSWSLWRQCNGNDKIKMFNQSNRACRHGGNCYPGTLLYCRVSETHLRIGYPLSTWDYDDMQKIDLKIGVSASRLSNDRQGEMPYEMGSDCRQNIAKGAMSRLFLIIMSSQGNDFLIIDPLWGENTGHRWIPLNKWFWVPRWDTSDANMC